MTIPSLALDNPLIMWMSLYIVEIEKIGQNSKQQYKKVQE